MYQRIPHQDVIATETGGTFFYIVQIKVNCSSHFCSLLIHDMQQITAKVIESLSQKQTSKASLRYSSSLSRSLIACV